jgi:hypothetical protein
MWMFTLHVHEGRLYNGSHIARDVDDVVRLSSFLCV